LPSGVADRHLLERAESLAIADPLPIGEMNGLARRVPLAIATGSSSFKERTKMRRLPSPT
jgi:hypothetical protein